MTYFIAEICSNHLNSLNRSKKIIYKAREIGCDAVKFQLFETTRLFSNLVLKKNKSLRNVKKLELSKKLIPELSKYAKKIGIKFGCTPFYLEAIDFLNPYVDFFKIGSYELLRKDLFIKCISKKKHIIFSTGMSTQNEIIDILNLFKKKNFYNFSILRCVSNYPTNIKDVNLGSIDTLRSLVDKKLKKKIKVGWSDHSRNASVIIKSIFKYNAEIVEFHFDIDGKGKEYAKGHCWLPKEIENVLDGNGKLEFSIHEKKERNWRSDPTDGLRPLLKERKK